MLAGRLARRLSRLGLHYSWVVLAVVFALSLVTAGAMALPGVLLLPLERQFGWSAEDISAAVALRLLIYGLMAPFAAEPDRSHRPQTRHDRRGRPDRRRPRAVALR